MNTRHAVILLTAGLLLLAVGLFPQVRPEPPPAAPPAGPVLDKRPVRLMDGVYYLGDYDVAALYLVEALDSLVLIDSGFSHFRSDVQDAVRSLGLDPAHIGHVLLTHRHVDHAMASGDFQAQTGALVYAGAADAELLESGGPMEAFFGDRFPPLGFRMPRLRIDRRLTGGEVLPIPGLDLTALATPGHTAGSMSYLLRKDGRRVLFSGDAVMSVGADLGTYVAYMDPRFGGDAEAYLETFRRVRGLEVDLLLPGHPYMDHDRTGLPAAPSLPPGVWKDRIDQGVAEMQRLLARYAADGRDFLNGRPRRIHERLLYLGELDGRAAYALEVDAGLVLVDAFPGDPQLAQRLAGLGRDAGQVRAVLLTETGGDLERAVQPASGVRVHAGRAAVWKLPGVSVDGALDGGEALAYPPLELHALATPGYGAGDMSYRVDLGGRSAIFSGRALMRLQKNVARRLELDGDEVNTAALQETLRGLRVLEPDLWLPSRPFLDQNANVYDGLWRAQVDGNLELLVHVR